MKCVEAARRGSVALFVIFFWLATLDERTTVSERKLSGADMIKSARNNTCHPHVIFTTFMCPSPACTPLRQRIESNTRQVWSSMDRVEFKDVMTSSVNTNLYGMPYIGDMFTHMMDACPDARTYTYINGDIIGTHGFIETIDAVLKIGEFLMVGRRTNVPWLETYDSTHEDFDFEAHFNRGELFLPNAIDYFTITKSAIDWDSTPPFVVGRAGYDNWLVEEMGWRNKKVALVDATQTAQMIHQTDGGGQFSWGGGTAKEKADELYNLRLAKAGNPRRRFAHGNTYNAEWETVRDTAQGRIIVRHKQFKLVW